MYTFFLNDVLLFLILLDVDTQVNKQIFPGPSLPPSLPFVNGGDGGNAARHTVAPLWQGSVLHMREPQTGQQECGNTGGVLIVNNSSNSKPSEQVLYQ